MTIQPIGSVVAYVGKASPKGWLLCDGTDIPKGKEYDDLRNLVGQKTPNLQGYFLRGLDPTGTTDKDKGRKILSIQQDSVGPHTHTYAMAFHMAAGKSGGDPPDVFADRSSANTSGPDGSPHDETRPINVAVNYIIKAIDEG
jgi:microcystin-dependent protein